MKDQDATPDIDKITIEIQRLEGGLGYYAFVLDMISLYTSKVCADTIPELMKEVSKAIISIQKNIDEEE